MYPGDRVDLQLIAGGPPEVVSPCAPVQEFWESAAVEGERRLLMAVLDDALRCFQKYAFASDLRGQELFREAEEWLMEPRTGAAFTFEYICEARGLDPDFLRSSLRRWCERLAADAGSRSSGR